MSIVGCLKFLPHVSLKILLQSSDGWCTRSSMAELLPYSFMSIFVAFAGYALYFTIWKLHTVTQS